MTPRIWLGLDPSISAFGWAVMRHIPGGVPHVVGIGTWATKVDHGAGKLADAARRVETIGGQLIALIDEHAPTEAFVESLVFGPKKGMLAISIAGRMRGLVEGICLARRIPLAECRPDTVKQAVAGRRDASKERVAEALRRLYVIHGPADDNATDALAVAHVGAHRHGPGYRLEANVVRYNPPPVDSEELDF